MADFKITIGYKWGDAGWSENFYRSGGTRLEAMSAGKSYVTQRRKSLTNYATAQFVRVTNVDADRDTSIFSYTGDTGFGRYSVFNDEVGGEANAAAVNVRLMSADGSKWRSMLVRGLPQAAIEAFYTNRIGEKWWEQYQLAIGAMKEGNFRFQRTVKGQSRPLVGYASTNGKMTSFNTETAFDPVPGMPGRVLIRDVQTVSNINGVWRLRTIGPAAAYGVFPKKQFNVGLAIIPQGTAYLLTYAYDVSINEGQLVGITSRKTGRPLLSPHGKRSVRKI